MEIPRPLSATGHGRPAHSADKARFQAWNGAFEGAKGWAAGVTSARWPPPIRRRRGLAIKAPITWTANDDQSLQATYTLLPCRMDALLLGSLCAWVVGYRPGLIKTECLYGGLALGGIVIASLTYRLSNFKLALYGSTVIAIFYGAFSC